jgi:hypothetical protein
VNPHFVYLNEYYERGEDFGRVWKRIEKDLIFHFGEPSDPRKAMTARWCPGLMTMGVYNIPQGVYIQNDDDVLLFLLKYPDARLRTPINKRI